MTLILSPYTKRNLLGRMMRERSPTGVGVEVGVHRGDYMSVLLREWPGAKIVGFDHWCVPKGYEEQAKTLSGGAKTRSEDFAEAKLKLRRYRERAHLIQDVSPECSRMFNDESLDFVYLDADHTRPGVDNDIRVWWRKLKPDGVLAGHDFLMPGEPDGGWGTYVQPAVMEHAALHGKDVHLIIEEGGLPWSWYIVK